MAAAPLCTLTACEPQRSGCHPSHLPEGGPVGRLLTSAACGPASPTPERSLWPPVLFWSSSSLLSHGSRLMFSSCFPVLCVWVISLRTVSVLESSDLPFLMSVLSHFSFVFTHFEPGLNQCPHCCSVGEGPWPLPSLCGCLVLLPREGPSLTSTPTSQPPG